MQSGYNGLVVLFMLAFSTFESASAFILLKHLVVLLVSNWAVSAFLSVHQLSNVNITLNTRMFIYVSCYAKMFVFGICILPGLGQGFPSMQSDQGQICIKLMKGKYVTEDIFCLIHINCCNTQERTFWLYTCKKCKIFELENTLALCGTFNNKN